MLTLDKESMEGKLTLQECWEALTLMQNALETMVLRRTLCSLFGESRKLLVSVFNYAFEVGELSSSQKQAVITLIQKKDRDNILIKN